MLRSTGARCSALLALVMPLAFSPPLAATEADVACVQEQLAAIGYDPGPVDGQIGGRTKSAVKRAQSYLWMPAEVAPSSVASAAEWCLVLKQRSERAASLTQPVVHTDLPADDPILQSIRAGIDAATEQLGAGVPVEIYIYSSPEPIAEAYARLTGNPADESLKNWQTWQAVATKGAFFVSARAIRRESWPAWEVFRTAAHEYMHVFHNAQMGGSFEGPEDQIPKDGPYWLAEGLADFFAYRALAARGHDEWSGKRKNVVRRDLPKLDGNLGALSSWQQMAVIRPQAYNISCLAVELLVAKTSFEQVSTGYWKARAGGGRWEDTFARVFGMTTDEFYAAFDSEFGR